VQRATEGGHAVGAADAPACPRLLHKLRFTDGKSVLPAALYGLLIVEKI
jgi:hypothetical protein